MALVKNPLGRFLVLGTGLTAALTAGLFFGAGWSLLPGYLAAVNASTVLIYAYDKWASLESTRARVPEAVLLLHTFAGGWTSCIVMGLLRHKTARPPFYLTNYGIIVLQGAAVLFYLFR